MSLAVLALRICAVKALIGQTSVGERVFDSVVDPRDLMKDAAQPVIVVCADSGKRDIIGHDLLGAGQTVDLCLELFVARGVAVAAGEGEERVEIEIPSNDAGHENYLRCLSYEVERALLGPGDWADLFRTFWFRAASDEQSVWDRGAHAEKGHRFAFLRLVYKIETLAEPATGAAQDPAWARLIAKMEADAELADLGAYLRQLIGGTVPPDWRAAQQAFGLPDATARSLGLEPLDDTTSDGGEQLGEINIDAAGEPAFPVSGAP